MPVMTFESERTNVITDKGAFSGRMRNFNRRTFYESGVDYEDYGGEESFYGEPSEICSFFACGIWEGD